LEENVDLIGKIIGNYQIVAEIGHGGMGTVYRAHQPSLSRWVAIKILSPNLEEDAEFFKRFKQEALATAALDHSNIIHIYDTGEDQWLHYIAMEYISGGNLFTRMKTRAGPLAVTEAVSIATQMALALDFAHRRGIVHRDVKPSNILLDPEGGRAVLSDLGIARALEGTRLTRTGITMGTPEYMSPEQAEGKPLDGRADLYSLGIVLYEMLTGHIPFQADTPLALLYKHIHEAPTDPRQPNPAIPKKLAAVVQKALAKDPAKRFASGQQMADALLASVPGARLQFATPAATIPVVTHTPKEIAVSILGTARQVSTRTLKGVGRFSLRLLLRLLEALVAVAVSVVLAVAILAVVFSFVLARYAQSTLSNYAWYFQDLGPSKPYVLTSSSFRQYATPYVTNATFGAIADADIGFASPDRVRLSAKVLGNPVLLDGNVFAGNGVPQVQLQRLNGIPLPVIDGIISNGVNQGFQEGWGKGPVRVVRFTITDTMLRMETENK
jgi:serine/threonine protein kinase